jgi:protoporphyrinogen oxidase
VLGAGLSGLAAAHTLGDLGCTVLEARSHAGGHASSFTIDRGFIFDEGPHVSFTPHARIKEFLARSVDNRFFEYPTYATNYYEGLILKHPVQCNLFGLPPELITKCIADFVRAQYAEHKPFASYKDWCYRGFGETIAEVFTRPYTRKYWNLELEQLTTDWVAERMYAPKLEEVLDGALRAQEGDHYYMGTFRYPETGGFGAYGSLLARDIPVRYNTRVVEIDFEHKKLVLADGSVLAYEHLISSAPLPEMTKLCKNAPPKVKEAGEKLSWTSHFVVSVGVNRPHISDAYWTYYYDEDIPFSRASFPSKYSAKTAPDGCSSVQVEVVHSRYKSIPSADVVIEQCLQSMLKVGLLTSRDEIVSVDGRDLRYSNVIFDFDRAPNRAIVHEFLKENGIHWCGRYGEWAYLWTDQSIISGERAANEVREAMGLASSTFEQGF